MAKRYCKKVVRGVNAIDGAGVHLRRVLGHNTIKDFDPFLMLDGFDSADPKDYVKGFPWHPHRGIETITYLLNGKIEHADSLGNKGIIADLQCQWMTAGSGIIHQEMPKPSPLMLGCQIWLNLPAKNKMTIPAYRDVIKEDVLNIQKDHSTVRIMSGSYLEKDGAVRNEYIKVQFLDVSLEPHTEWVYNETSNDQTLFIYLIEGALAADDTLSSFEKKGCALLMAPSSPSENDFDEVLVKAGEEGARFLLLAAKPLNEPVAWGGPIVMNTQEELNNAFEELDNNTFIKHSNPDFL